ncbi:hypothetical protein C8N35_106136 [Breoghania corrubedonensis]|uniref:Uncharacterized protein n=1 Tax=Breoghania corrubedonensis TaxID=665038 RepID=A0A2T5V7P1_9HYPH|nr:hypothetical protein [Breoghania corrubedonensis]PTW59751.1 hypothetical protein C8N35_106136 [Breoghania corrubedonensis]
MMDEGRQASVPCVVSTKDGRSVRLPRGCSLWFNGYSAPRKSAEDGLPRFHIRRLDPPPTPEPRQIQVDYIDDDVVVRGPFGVCPVQADGLVDGDDFYFRARGNYWSLSIGGNVLKAPDWYYEEDYGVRFEAGGMSMDEALQCILKAARLFRSGAATMEMK